MTKDEMKAGKLYQFQYQDEVLKYLGYNWSSNGYWHQFEKLGKQGVWAEITNSDLWMIVEYKESNNE
jgi:hypothetical protein